MSALAWTAPWLAAAAVPAGVIVAAIARHRFGRGRAGFAWAAASARGAAVSLALFAAAGPRLAGLSDRDGERFVAAPDDVSVDGADRVVRWGPGADAPDAAAAVEMLRAAAAPGTPTTISLTWSGAEGDPPGLAAATALARARDNASILEPEDGSSGRALLPAPRLVLPASATEGIAFQVVVDAGDLPFDGTSVRWSVDGQDVEMRPPSGSRRAWTPPVAVRAGTHVLAAHVEGRAPAATVLRVAEAPKVLLVLPAAVEPPLARRLRTQGLKVILASESTCDMAPPVDVVVLGPGAGATCAADVASRVAAGTGLLVAGGEGPRGLVRLRGTPLETLLPVEIPAPPPPEPAPPPPPKPPEKPPNPEPDAPKPVLDEADRQALRVALLLCIDRSGSMAGVKMAMARESAIAAAKTLSSGDRVGVIAFDEQAQWVAPFQDVDDLRGLVRRVQDLDADGGTNFFPALKAGYAAILEQKCGIRHVVLITDGATRAAVFRDLVEGGTAQGVTLSAVAIGEGADLRLLGLLAQWGKGRLYPATDPELLPQVLTLDTKRFLHAPRDAAKELKEKPAVPDLPTAEQPTKPTESDTPPEETKPPEPPKGAPPRAPRVAFAAPFLAGIETEPWPELVHPETIRPRGAATAPLVWEDGTPALVLGRAAAGRCAVVAADVVTTDARSLWNWLEGGRALAQLARGLAPPPAPTDDAPEVRFAPLADGRAVAIVGAAGGGVLRLRPAGGGEEIRAICRAAGEVSIAELRSMPALGVWSGEFAAHDAEAAAAVAAGSAGPPPRDDRALAAELAERSGAPLVRALPGRVPGRPYERHEDRTAPLVLGAALLLLAEAALRRGVHG